MATIVNITIRNSTYQIACDEGQEEKVKAYAINLDKRVKNLSSNFPKANDLMLLIMSGLIMENEIKELSENPNKINNTNSDLAVTETINAVSDYVETLAKRLEKIYTDI
ncbi:MAG: cell division protein ZapA [Alphaproteobacteria bacterium]